MEGHFVFNNYKYFNPGNTFWQLDISPFSIAGTFSIYPGFSQTLASLLEIPGEDISPTPNFL